MHVHETNYTHQYRKHLKDIIHRSTGKKVHSFFILESQVAVLSLKTGRRRWESFLAVVVNNLLSLAKDWEIEPTVNAE